MKYCSGCRSYHKEKEPSCYPEQEITLLVMMVVFTVMKEMINNGYYDEQHHKELITMIYQDRNTVVL